MPISSAKSIAKVLTPLHLIHLTLGSSGLLISMLWPVETFLRIAMLGIWLCSVAVFVGTLTPFKEIANLILVQLLNNKVRVFAIIFLLIALLLAGLMLVVSRTRYLVPPLALYIPFVIGWPLLTIQLLKVSARDALPDAASLIAKFQLMLASVVLFWLFLEILLQIGFNYLPPQITMSMPQQPQRLGIHYDPDLHLDLYSPGKITYIMDGSNGDLNKEICPTTAKAEPRTVATYTRDEHGFRNAMPWPDKIDVAFAGDSFTAGEAVQHPMWDGLTPSLLELGLPGSGQLEQLELVRAFALPRKPKVVVMAYYEGNDLADNWTYHQLREVNSSRYEGNSSAPWKYLVTYNLLLWLRDKLIATQQANCEHEIVDAHGSPLVFGTYDSSTLTLNKSTLQDSPIFALTKNAIKESTKEVQDSGAKFVILFIPHKLHTYWNTITAANVSERLSHVLVALQPDPITGLKPDPTVQTSNDVVDRLKQNINSQRDLIMQTADEVGALFLDLTPAFQSAAENGKVLYFYGDVHLNQTGHDLARDVIRQFFEQNKLLN